MEKFSNLGASSLQVSFHLAYLFSSIFDKCPPSSSNRECIVVFHDKS